MMRRLAMTAVFAALPALAMADTFDGTYRQTANADCGLVGVDGGALKIEDGIFYGVEMECRMTRPVNVVDMDAMLYTLQCSGGDQTWSERAMVMDDAETEGGIIMLWNGYAFRYSRCPDDSAETSTAE